MPNQRIQLDKPIHRITKNYNLLDVIREFFLLVKDLLSAFFFFESRSLQFIRTAPLTWQELCYG
jgi:hypothetical protein